MRHLAFSLDDLIFCVSALLLTDVALNIKHSRVQPIYRFADIIGRYRPIADILVLVHMFSYLRQYQNCLKGLKKTWTSDLK